MTSLPHEIVSADSANPAAARHGASDHGTRGDEWFSPERGLWVAQREGEYLGMIDGGDDGYSAMTAEGEVLGLFDELAEAQAAIESTPEASIHSHPRRTALAAAACLAAMPVMGALYVAITHVVI